ncbi:hypothetical protein GDO81_021091 [Engystomops pustulosus]|uniref:Uncharacterized protein n=1 Tax=Engystomops pustulosus TaxID=76066 RepID=A0AAV6YT86_ENGPU|nr:hypothetical protein GDO81_021091 [Engystomops pustulosus]
MTNRREHKLNFWDNCNVFLLVHRFRSTDYDNDYCYLMTIVTSKANYVTKHYLLITCHIVTPSKSSKLILKSLNSIWGEQPWWRQGDRAGCCCT